MHPCSGWLVLDKPAGITSTAVLNEIKKLIPTQIKKNKIKVGHAGTLDPFATGILLIAFGEATKTVEYAMASNKAYEFTVAWGEDRDTLDIDGKVVATSDIIPTQEEVIATLGSFVGTLQQAPPAYSAIKIAGRRAYDIARKGERVELKPRKVDCFMLELLYHNIRPLSKLASGSHTNSQIKQSKFLVECGKGFYVRSLARDIAAKLGACGYVSTLRRVRSGKFTIGDAITLDYLKEVLYANGDQYLTDVLKPVSAVLDGILVQQVALNDARKLKQGQKIKIEFTGKDNELVLAVCDGKEIAICQASSGGVMAPIKVFNIV